MPVIKCYNCRLSNPNHVVGSYDEYRYYSVSSRNDNDTNGKIFFCSEFCHDESSFIDAVLSEASKHHDIPDIRPTMNDIMRNQVLGPIADEMQAHFDEIVAPMRNEYSLKIFRERQKQIQKHENGPKK